jgi:hypothetical protein
MATGHPGCHVVPRISATRSEGSGDTVPVNRAGSGVGVGDGVCRGDQDGMTGGTPSLGDASGIPPPPDLSAAAVPHAGSKAISASAQVAMTA